MEFDWRLAGDGNPFAEFAQGYQGGQQIKRQRERDNLFAQQQAFEMQQAQRKQALQEQAIARQQQVGAAIGKGDFAGARTAAGGDLDMLKSIGELDDQRRKALAQSAEYAAAQLIQLRGLDPQEQARRWELAKPSLVARGLDAAELNIDFTQPGAIERELADAMSLKDMIALADKERDDTRAQEKAKADEAYRAKMLSQNERRIGLAADANRRGWAAHRERQRQGGYGAPGMGGSGIDPGEVDWDQ